MLLSHDDDDEKKLPLSPEATHFVITFLAPRAPASFRGAPRARLDDLYGALKSESNAQIRNSDILFRFDTGENMKISSRGGREAGGLCANVRIANVSFTAAKLSRFYLRGLKKYPDSSSRQGLSSRRCEI